MNFIDSFLPNFQHFGLWGYWIVLIITFLESIAVIGVFVPATVIMAFIGFLSSQGYLNVVNLILFASVGAILGDVSSYYMGTRGTGLFKNENRILKLGHLEKAKAFFAKHGDKSVFLGGRWSRSSPACRE
jgi:undecaprenyl-diphosphatase